MRQEVWSLEYLYRLHKSNLPKYPSRLHPDIKACLHLSILLGYPGVALQVCAHANCRCHVCLLLRTTAPTFPTRDRKTMTEMGSAMPVMTMTTMTRSRMTG